MSLFGQMVAPYPMTPYPMRMPMMYPFPMAAGGVTFVRRVQNVPGQPYQMRMDPKQVEAALYKDLPLKEEAPPAKGTTPVKLIKMDSGLEVPDYLLKREAERKRLELIEKSTPRVIPPTLFKIGDFAASSPGKTTLVALGIGSLVAHMLLA